MAGVFRRMIQTVDSHTEGNSTRVITGGYPVPPGVVSNRLMARDGRRGSQSALGSKFQFAGGHSERFLT
jgi:proline racemase